MTYQLDRGGETYGPYTLEDLKRYLAAGNVLPSDMVRSTETGSTEARPWQSVGELLAVKPPPMPVDPEPAASTVLYASASPASASTYPISSSASPVYPGSNPAFAGSNPASGISLTAFPDAPNLHWGLVLLFTWLTCGVFLYVWDLVQSSWMRRVKPDSKALAYYLLSFGLFAIYLVLSLAANSSGEKNGALGALSGLFFLAFLVMVLVARFSLRTSLEQHFNGPEPVGLVLGGVMTFFFGTIYFQYHLNRIHALKQAARYALSR